MHSVSPAICILDGGGVLVYPGFKTNEPNHTMGYPKSTLFSAIVGLSSVLVGCGGGGGGGSDSQPFLGGLFSGTLSKTEDTCNGFFNEFELDYNVNQDGEQIAATDGGGRGNYSGMTTSANSFEASGQDGNCILTELSFSSVDDTSAILSQTLNFSCGLLGSTFPCQVTHRGPVTRRTR